MRRKELMSKILEELKNCTNEQIRLILRFIVALTERSGPG